MMLWLVKQQLCIWVAVHASETCTTNAEVLHENRLVFGSWETDVTAAGSHKWDKWDTATSAWQGKQNWFFETRVVEPEG